MDSIFLAFFLLAAFIGGFASGLAGFAMGFVVSGVWLHFLTPIETTTLTGWRSQSSSLSRPASQLMPALDS